MDTNILPASLVATVCVGVLVVLGSAVALKRQRRLKYSLSASIVFVVVFGHLLAAIVCGSTSLTAFLLIVTIWAAAGVFLAHLLGNEDDIRGREAILGVIMGVASGLFVEITVLVVGTPLNTLWSLMPYVADFRPRSSLQLVGAVHCLAGLFASWRSLSALRQQGRLRCSLSACVVFTSILGILLAWTALGGVGGLPLALPVSIWAMAPTLYVIGHPPPKNGKICNRTDTDPFSVHGSRLETLALCRIFLLPCVFAMCETGT